MRRVRRIFPAFYSYLFVMGLLWAAGVLHLTAEQMFCAASFTWNIFRPYLEVQAADGSFIAHFWSLAVEEQFTWSGPPPFCC